MEARLVLVGRFFAAGHVDDLAARIKRLQALEPRFTYYSDISDDALHGLYGEARATIYASQIEGFGLPPVESLHCGVPVIVYQDLPSVVNLPMHGQIRLRRMSASAIAWGVRLLQDDEFAARLWAGAGTIPTTEWSDVASDVAHWAVSR